MEDKKITLNYKASNIAKAEEATGKSFIDSFAGLSKRVSFADLRFLVLAGGGTDDDFDALFASGTENMMVAILEGINAAGFLGSEKMDIEALKTQMHETMGKAVSNTKTSQNSGEATKEQPSE